MAPGGTYYLQKERPYFARPFHGRLCNSVKKPLSRQQYFPKSVEVGFVPPCCEQTRYVSSTSLRCVPFCWANLPYTLPALPEDRMPRPGQVVASSLRNMKGEGHGAMPRATEHRTVP